MEYEPSVEFQQPSELAHRVRDAIREQHKDCDRRYCPLASVIAEDVQEILEVADRSRTAAVPVSSRYVVLYAVEDGFRELAEGPLSEAEAFARRNELFDVEGASSVRLIEYVGPSRRDVQTVDFVDSPPPR